MEKRIKETMTKKKVLIAYGGMVVGGSTTALLSMLKEWNFEKYDVDLILYDRGFPFEKDIPNQVHILNGRRSMPNGYMQRLKKGIQYRYEISSYKIDSDGKKIYSEDNYVRSFEY